MAVYMYMYIIALCLCYRGGQKESSQSKGDRLVCGNGDQGVVEVYESKKRPNVINSDCREPTRVTVNVHLRLEISPYLCVYYSVDVWTKLIEN